MATTQQVIVVAVLDRLDAAQRDSGVLVSNLA
jgi:hypothetical protein